MWMSLAWARRSMRRRYAGRRQGRDGQRSTRGAKGLRVPPRCTRAAERLRVPPRCTRAAERLRAAPHLHVWQVRRRRPPVSLGGVELSIRVRQLLVVIHRPCPSGRIQQPEHQNSRHPVSGGGAGESTPPPTTTTPPASGTCSAAYTVSSSWRGGYQGGVTVTACSAPIRGWTVTLTYPGAVTVQQAWIATVNASGSQITATNAAYNGTLGGRHEHKLRLPGVRQPGHPPRLTAPQPPDPFRNPLWRVRV
ncbi:cellulose binding domain-containing protein [Actinoplanes sp. TBRC 11911]|uniref:cellulose binding domain-containing protein n=1 Tax=Actinoplanes sp. TBRC 11911 TaxID=2729386 RepID=UPI00289FFA46|nr:cellulose binding domain-containing protein [Actinoplanes sp. TBRC 11911]